MFEHLKWATFEFSVFNIIKFRCIEAFCREGASTSGFLLLEHRQSFIILSSYVHHTRFQLTQLSEFIPTIQLFALHFVFFYSVLIRSHCVSIENCVDILYSNVEIEFGVCFSVHLNIAIQLRFKREQYESIMNLHTINFHSKRSSSLSMDFSVKFISISIF